MIFESNWGESRTTCNFVVCKPEQVVYTVTYVVQYRTIISLCLGLVLGVRKYFRHLLHCFKLLRFDVAYNADVINKIIYISLTVITVKTALA